MTVCFLVMLQLHLITLLRNFFPVFIIGDIYHSWLLKECLHSSYNVSVPQDFESNFNGQSFLKKWLRTSQRNVYFKSV